MQVPGQDSSGPTPSSTTKACGKSMEMQNVTDVAVKTSNYVCTCGLNHRQFQHLLAEMNMRYKIFSSLLTDSLISGLTQQGVENKDELCVMQDINATNRWTLGRRTEARRVKSRCGTLGGAVLAAPGVSVTWINMASVACQEHVT